MQEYDQIAEWYVVSRNPNVGIPQLAALACRLSPHARVLDLGCGDGVPISRFLIREGFDVVAVDSALEMIARYQANFPGIPTRCERAEQAEFALDSFDAVVAWGMFFHLTEAEQRDVLCRIGRWLRPGGLCLFTSGDVNAVSEGEMNGVAFRYVSLDVNGYRDAIEGAGMCLESSHRDDWDNCVYLARKPT